MDPQVTIHFTCQRCHQPVNLDQGFSHLSELTLAELALSSYPSSDVNFDGLDLDKVVSPFNLSDSNPAAHGFTVVGDTIINQKLSPLKVTSNLFDLLSSNSNIDHPLCEECTDYLLETTDEYLARAEKQSALYDKLLSDYTDSDDDTSALEKELQLLLGEESHLLKDLKDVEVEQLEAQDILAQCQEEKEKIEEEELNYRREYCAYRCQVIALEDENRSLKSRINFMQQQLDLLRQTNIFNTTFHIWYSGHFATINNLRLGRLPTVSVMWPEVNAAWGQTALLLSSLARKIGLEFSKYELVPFGSASYIKVIGENKELPLFGSGGLRFLWDHKFDAGMVAFLECAHQFQRHIESFGFTDSQKDAKKKFCLPYRIVKHCMEDSASGQLYSIKMQFNSEEHWTKALKFLLTNLKWALTWVSSPKFFSPTDA